jgi:hypothetical protein
MRALIRIVRDRDQSVLEQDVADVADGSSLGAVIHGLIDRIRTAHPQTELLDFTIKVAGADKAA